MDLDEHILNISSYELSFFQKLVLCRGLNFALPQRVSPIEVKASFEKAYWSLERSLSDEKMIELAATTLRSVALNYIERKGPRPLKALLVAIEELKRRDDIVITKPDQEIIKVREVISHTGLIPIVIPLRLFLRTVPTIVIAHTFCASPDTRISYRRCLLIQRYYCAV